jgi:hypothetical protein
MYALHITSRLMLGVEDADGDDGVQDDAYRAVMDRAEVDR